jgi:hypothetical protein
MRSLTHPTFLLLLVAMCGPGAVAAGYSVYAVTLPIQFLMALFLGEEPILLPPRRIPL